MTRTGAQEGGAKHGVGAAAMDLDGNDDMVSVLGLSALLLRHLRVLVGVPVVCVLIALFGSMISGPTYTAYSSFLPTGAREDALSKYASLAAQVGWQLPTADGGQSSEFYARLVTTPALLEAAAKTAYEFPASDAGTDTVSGTLFQIFGITGDTPQEQLAKMLDFAGERVTAKVDAATGVVSIRTTTAWPDLSILWNRRLLQLVAEFNLETRQSQAKAERQFIEQRVANAREELQQAESELETFLEQNRTYRTSPQLSFEVSRLQRRVELRQQVYESLAQAFERARIEEVRNTPVITIIDHPEGLVIRNSSMLKNAVMLGIAGVFLAMGWIVLREVFARQRREMPHDYAVFLEARNRAVAQVLPSWLLRRAWPKSISRRGGGGGAVDRRGMGG